MTSNSLHPCIPCRYNFFSIFFWIRFCNSDHFLKQIPTVTVTFVLATFVRAIFIHNRNISTVTDLFFDQTLMVGFWDHLNSCQLSWWFFWPKIFVFFHFFAIFFDTFRNVWIKNSHQTPSKIKRINSQFWYFFKKYAFMSAQRKVLSC